MVLLTTLTRARTVSTGRIPGQSRGGSVLLNVLDPRFQTIIRPRLCPIWESAVFFSLVEDQSPLPVAAIHRQVICPREPLKAYRAETLGSSEAGPSDSHRRPLRPLGELAAADVAQATQ